MERLPSSPVKRTLNSASRYAAVGEPPALQLYKEMDDEMRLSFVGPMPVELFFETFLPISTKISNVKRNGLMGFEEMNSAGLENQMYDEFVRRRIPICYLRISHCLLHRLRL